MENNYDTFKRKLVEAVDHALYNPAPTKILLKHLKAHFKHGLTNGQYRIVIQVYNSTIRRMKYLKEKAN